MFKGGEAAEVARARGQTDRGPRPAMSGGVNELGEAEIRCLVGFLFFFADGLVGFGGAVSCE